MAQEVSLWVHFPMTAQNRRPANVARMLLASPRREYPAGMRVAPFPRSLALLLMVISLVPQPLAAQHVLVAKDHGEMLLVCSANGNKPRVQKDGKIVLINPSGFALREVPEFLPVYVTVRNVNVRTTYVSTHAGSGELNNDFHFDAEFESSHHEISPGERQAGHQTRLTGGGCYWVLSSRLGARWMSVGHGMNRTSRGQRG